MIMAKKLLVTLLILTTLQFPSALAMKRNRKEKVQETPSRKKGFSQEELNKSLLAEVQQIQPGSSLDTIRQLLEQGADANMEKNESTLLSFAIKKESTELVQLLLDHKARVNTPSGQFGMTALMIAAKDGDQPMCELLIAKGANVRAQDGHGNSAWSRANEGGHDAICALLLEHGAQTDTLTTKDYKPTWVLDEVAFEKMLTKSAYGKKILSKKATSKK